MNPTKEQQEEALLAAGWTYWSEEMPDGTRKKVPFWKDELGETKAFFNERKQWEYSNANRRFTLAEAWRIQELREATAVKLAKERAELAAKQGLSPVANRAMTAADLAAMAAEQESAA